MVALLAVVLATQPLFSMSTGLGLGITYRMFAIGAATLLQVTALADRLPAGRGGVRFPPEAKPLLTIGPAHGARVVEGGVGGGVMGQQRGDLLVRSGLPQPVQTILHLDVPPTLARTLRSTNPIRVDDRELPRPRRQRP